MCSQPIVLGTTNRGATPTGAVSGLTRSVPSTPPVTDNTTHANRRSLRLRTPDPRLRDRNHAAWLSSALLITPQALRKLPRPHFCPLCPPSRRHISATTVPQLLNHLRTTHCARSVAGKPRQSQLATLSALLKDIGYWYCPTHDKYLGTNVGSRTPAGSFRFTYAACPRCAVTTSPPCYRPLHRSQLAAAPSNPIDIAAAPESDPPPPPGSASQQAQPILSERLPTAQEIFTTHIPLVSHIPTRQRPTMAESFRQTVQAAVESVENTRDTASEDFLKIFLFPSVMFTNHSSQDAPHQPNAEDCPHGPSSSEVYRRKIQLWAEGKYKTLWDEALRCATSRPSRALPPQEQEQANAKRALRLAKEGAYSKAAQALQSHGIIPPSAETSQALRDKHPQAVPRGDTAEYTRPDVRPRFTPFTTEQVLHAMRKFRPGTAAGGSGLRPNHLAELLRVPCLNHTRSLATALTKLVNILASGSAPRTLCTWLAGAPLTALAKREPGIRPIAVGETIRRLVSICGMSRVASKAAAFLRPLQVGIATKGGAEATVHAVRRLHERFHRDSRYALLSVDLKNAFNLCSRNAFLESTKRLFPEILTWVEYCYASGDAFLWTGLDLLRSVVGVQQGDPLGPLLFVLALHPLLKKIQHLLSTGASEDRELAELLLQLWYLDDGYIIASHEALQAALELLASEEATSRGLHLNLRKCRVWWPTPPSEDVQQKYPADLQQHYTEGTLILQAPLGSHAFMEECVLKHVRSLQPLFDAISSLEDTHVAFQLLRNCMGVCKMSYLLRTVPPASIAAASDLYDNMVEQTLRAILGGVLDPDIFKELQLPLRPDNKENPSLGIGLTSAVSVSAASFLASAASSNDICTTSLPGEITALTTYHAAVDSHNVWTSQCHENAIPLTDFCVPQPPSQHLLTGLVHKHAQEALPPAEARLKSFRACMSLPGAKEWVYCTPAPGLRTYICSREFRTWLQYSCQVPLFGNNSACPREGCPENVDPNGDHLLHCRYGFFRTRRHDQQVKLLASDLSRAVRHPIVEPREQGHHRVRPDVAATGTHGGTDYFDVTFVNPMAPSYTRARHFNPLSSLNAAHREKHRRFHDFIQTAGEAANLLPVPLSAVGGWHPATFSLLRTIAGAIATRAAEPLWKARSILFQRHAALAVMSNAMCLLGDSPSLL